METGRIGDGAFREDSQQKAGNERAARHAGRGVAVQSRTDQLPSN